MIYFSWKWEGVVRHVKQLNQESGEGNWKWK